MLDIVRDVNFVLKLHALADILEPVEIFRKYFEADNNLAHKVNGKLLYCLGELQAIKDDYGPELKKLTKRLKKSGVWECGVFGIKRVNLTGAFNEEEFQVFLASAIDDIEQFLKERFPDTDIMKNFEIFDPQFWSTVPKASLHKEGRQQFKKLLDHFCNKKPQKASV